MKGGLPKQAAPFLRLGSLCQKRNQQELTDAYMNRKRGKWGVYVEKKIGGLCIQ